MTLAEIWHFEFMRHALISACLLGPVCALLGVFVTLRGMAFFSDALAHSAVTGVALGFLLREQFGWAVDPTLCVLVFSFFLASLMAWLFQRTHLLPDTVIAFSFSGSVAFGVVVLSYVQQYRLLDQILFGSIYANGPAELRRQVLLALFVFVFLLWQMRRYTLSTLSPELARARGLRTAWLNYAFALLLAATITVALPMLGALLLSALIVIPPAAGKLISHSFRGMLLVTLSIGALAPPLGVIVSAQLDVPTGPCMVLVNIAVLLACYGLKGLRQMGRAGRPGF